MMLSHIDNLWIVGCGAMGGALLSRWREAGLRDASTTVIDPTPKGLPHGFSGRILTAPPSMKPDIIVLGIKPQTLAAAGPALRASLAGAPLIISMLAGVRLQTLAEVFPHARLARIMPNTPVRVGKGVTGIHAPALSAADRELLDGLIAPTGTAVWLDDEARFDALTAVSGSGPAYLFRFIEALTGAAEAAGLDQGIAARLAQDTIVGAAVLAASSDQAPAALRQAVTSPNGVTQAGLDVLDGEGGLSALLRATVRAAAERSRVLAAEADAAVAPHAAA